VLFDKDNDYVYVYVFYTNLSGTDKIAYKKIPLSWLDPVFFTPTGSLGSESAFLSCCTDPDPDVNVGLNDVTSTKQQVDNTMEILVVASGSYPSADRRAYYKVLSLP
jgi:hypothetical protein